MVGLILFLIVGAILASLFGGWIVGIPIAAFALVLFVLFTFGWRRRAPAGKP